MTNINFKKELESIIDQLNDPKNEWPEKSYYIVTDKIKTLFAAAGSKLGYCIAAHKNKTDGLEYDEGEWMFDLVWFKMDDNDNQLMTEIPLVLESELSKKNYGGFKEDLDKLLIATSSTKVFVTTIQNINKKREYVQKAINGFKGFKNDEIFYLIVWDENDEGKFYLEDFCKKI